MEVRTAEFRIADPGADNKQLFLMKAPADAYGGGITLLEAYAVNKATKSGGTTFTYALHKYSNAGTPAVNGTIAAAIGGTTDYWADGVPKAFTLDASYVFLDAGEWLVLDYQEISTGSPTLSSIHVTYAMGK